MSEGVGGAAGGDDVVDEENAGRNGAGGDEGKGFLHVAAAFHAAEFFLGDGFPGADNQIFPKRDAGAFKELTGKKGSLVIAAFRVAAWMNRDGNENGRIPVFDTDVAVMPDAFGEEGRVFGTAVVFEAHQGFLHASGVGKRRESLIKFMGKGCAFRTFFLVKAAQDFSAFHTGAGPDEMQLRSALPADKGFALLKKPVT